jgi:cellulose biosynthesis protein BcsQ
MAHHLHDLPHGARTVLFSGAKGGVGTSTVAALHALALARAGFSTMLTATTDVQLGDLAALLGIPNPRERLIDVNATAALAPLPGAGAVVVIDAGTEADPQVAVSEHYLVVRPCYLALRRAMVDLGRPQGIVLVAEPERSLTRADVEDVLGLAVVATLAVQPSTARLLDAGLLAAQLAHRLPLVWAQ